MKQHTLKKEYTFEGKGLHTGAAVRMTVCPAAENHGIVFSREDLGGIRIEADIRNLTTTDHSTCLKADGADVITTEHLMSAFSGLGIDNALVKLSTKELPILDGSALPYVSAFQADGLQEQNAERRYITIEKEFTFTQGDSRITFSPASEFSADVEIVYPSKVIGHQKALFDPSMDYAKEIAPCRTFCFFHEIEFLLAHNLIKGGDIDNAIVIVENEVPQETIDRLKSIITNAPDLKRISTGYLNNLSLHFENECARHKLLDVIGDVALAGKPLLAHVSAYKPGHGANTAAVKALMDELDK